MIKMEQYMVYVSWHVIDHFGIELMFDQSVACAVRIKVPCIKTGRSYQIVMQDSIQVAYRYHHGMYYTAQLDQKFAMSYNNYNIGDIYDYCCDGHHQPR